MACTTILVGKKATYDGSTMIARTEDLRYWAKKAVIIDPEDQPRTYTSVRERAEINRDIGIAITPEHGKDTEATFIGHVYVIEELRNELSFPS